MGPVGPPLVPCAAAVNGSERTDIESEDEKHDETGEVRDETLLEETEEVKETTGSQSDVLELLASEDED